MFTYIKMILYVILFALLLFLGVAFFLWKKKEGFAPYPGENDFMKIYYEQVAEDPDFVRRFPYWGTGNKTGLRCRFPNNQGCDTVWISGRLVEITDTLKKNLECKYGMPWEKVLVDIV